MTDGDSTCSAAVVFSSLQCAQCWTMLVHNVRQWCTLLMQDTAKSVRGTILHCDNRPTVLPTCSRCPQSICEHHFIILILIFLPPSQTLVVPIYHSGSSTYCNSGQLRRQTSKQANNAPRQGVKAATVPLQKVQQLSNTMTLMLE